MAPVMATIEPLFFANSFTNATAWSKVSSVTASATSASTPFVVPLPDASVLISEILPRITVGCKVSISSIAVPVRSADAPAPTGSSKTGCPISFARFPASNIPAIVRLFNVPILIFRPPQMLVISSTSSASSAMIGLPPQASSTFATSFTVT